jgi:hypothetical protein
MITGVIYNTITVGLLAELTFQSVTDAKTKTIYSAPNNLFAAITTGVYAGSLILTKTAPEPLCLGTIAGLIIFSGLKFYAPADAKALISVLLATGLAVGNPTRPDVFIFLCGMLVSEVLMLLYGTVLKIRGHISEKKNPIAAVETEKGGKRRKVKIAYFPFLTIGYLVELLLLRVCYG